MSARARFTAGPAAATQASTRGDSGISRMRAMPPSGQRTMSSTWRPPRDESVPQLVEQQQHRRGARIVSVISAFPFAAPQMAATASR